MAALFVGWSAFFIYVLIRFRKSRQPKADYQGVKSGISTHLEFAVVLIEAVLLIGFAIPIWGKYVDDFPDDKEAVLIHAVGQQFNWNYHMPGPDGSFGRRELSLVSNSNPLGLDPNSQQGKDDLVVLGEVHVPVKPAGDHRGFFQGRNPQLRGASHARRAGRDPGADHPALVHADQKPGTYEVVCGQLCGLGHYAIEGNRRCRYA
jgi:cytochrome c oxidase subunit 2